MAPTTETAINWDAVAATAETVAQVKVSKTLADIPPAIAALVEQSLASGNVLRVVLPTGTAAKVFAREARDYGFMHDPRLSVRISPEGDGLAVRFKAYPYTPPGKGDK